LRSEKLIPEIFFLWHDHPRSPSSAYVDHIRMALLSYISALFALETNRVCESRAANHCPTAGHSLSYAATPAASPT
jgi:hypothetical protein